MNAKRRDIVLDKIHDAISLKESDDHTILDDLINAELIGALHRELNQLPEGCQRVCRLIYLEGMKYDEVAQELDVSVNTVKTQRIRAINLLKTKFLNLILNVLLF